MKLNFFFVISLAFGCADVADSSDELKGDESGCAQLICNPSIEPLEPIVIPPIEPIVIPPIEPIVAKPLLPGTGGYDPLPPEIKNKKKRKKRKKKPKSYNKAQKHIEDFDKEMDEVLGILREQKKHR